MKGYYYLGSPYSKYPAGINRAHRDVCVEAGRLVKAGIAVYSPIAHCHPISQHSGINPLDVDLWIPVDEPLMVAAKGLIVLTMDGWEKSVGLGYEISFFEELNRPVIYMLPGFIPECLL